MASSFTVNMFFVTFSLASFLVSFPFFCSASVKHIVLSCSFCIACSMEAV